MLSSIVHDLRYALRTLAKSPGFAFVAIASLTLGIGANSAIFSLVRATLLPTLPFHDVDRLVDLHETSADLCPGCAVGTSLATFRDWQARTRAFASMGAARDEEFVVAGSDDVERVSGALVSSTLFPTLGVRPVMGRSFAADEDRPGAPRVVLLSHGVWERMFGGDTAIVGRSIRVNGAPAAVVGVMPERFGYPEFAKMWAPIGAAAVTDARDDRSVGVVARIAAAATLEQARSDIASVGAGVAREHPDEYRGWSASASPVVDALRADSGPPFLVLLGASAFVLLIACANLANLLLARASRREREVAVRVALGAGRARLIRMLLAESVVVSFAGGALGLLLSLWGVDAVPRLLGTQVPFWIVFVVDWRVVTFAIVLSALTAL